MDFLLTLAGNLPFLIVVLAGLFSLYKKFNSPGGSQSQQGRPRPARPMNPMPTFGGGPGEARKPVRKAVPNPWEEEQERRRREELAERQQEDWRREERAETERRAQRESEESSPREASSRPQAGRPERMDTRAGRSPFQVTTTDRTTASRVGLRDEKRGIGSIDTAAHASGEWTADGEEMAKAVIWSEILGPPRSKRPYGR